MLRYLARYVHRAAITYARMLAVRGDHVSFSYKDAQAHTSRRMTLPGDEFLRPFLQHVLPSGFHKVRYYGLWAPAAQATGGASSRAWAPRTSSRRHLTRHRTSGRRDPTPRPCPQCASGVLRLDRHLAPCRGLSIIPP